MALSLYPPIIKEAELSTPTYGTEIDDACKEIHDACKGWGSDKKRLIEILGTKSQEERFMIALHYKVIYEKDLADVMKKETSGDFGLAMQWLALPPDVAECAMIKKACDGLGTNEKLLYPIVCGRTNAEIDRLKKTYFKTHTRDLGKRLGSELGGKLERIVFNNLQGDEEKFDPLYHTEDKAVEDAEAIHKAVKGWGIDDKTVFKIICASPPQHLDAINKAYADKYGYTLSKQLDKELGGILGNDAKKAALFTIGMKLKPYETIAHLIKSACAGFGTDETLLTSCIIRYQHVLKNVMVAHIELFGKTVQDRVKSEVSGNYRDLLLKILDTVWPMEY